MKHLSIKELEQLLTKSLTKQGVSLYDANIVANIYIRASLRGVGHHDFNDIFGRLNYLKKGAVNPRPKITLETSFGGLEVWNGDNGLGELCCHHITTRSIALAREHGIGFATVCNSNHFLAAAPYSEIADEAGFLTLVMSKSPGGISLEGSSVNVMGNNPFGYSAGHGKDPILFDICCAYSSYGKMNALAKEGASVPDYWGFNADGHKTTDPSAILKSGLYAPLGGHKGFGLAIMIELYSAVLSGGNILHQDHYDGPYAQTAISIDVSKLMPMTTYEARVETLKNLFKDRFADVYIPGSRSNDAKRAILEKGTIGLEDNLYNQLLKWSTL